MNTEISPQNIERFRRIARNGSNPGASSGERIANRLAKALAAIGDDLALLDPDTLAGALDLARCMAGPWPTDHFREVVFRTVDSAAGKKLPKRKGAVA